MTSALWLIETRTEMLSMPSGWTVGEMTSSIEDSGLPFGSLGSGRPATETRASEPEMTETDGKLITSDLPVFGSRCETVPRTVTVGGGAGGAGVAAARPRDVRTPSASRRKRGAMGVGMVLFSLIPRREAKGCIPRARKSLRDA